MEFTQKKLPLEASDSLKVFPIQSVKAYSLMPCPVYIFMKLNKKFVSVKAPLDFFVPSELEQYSPYESFFFTSFIDYATPFRSSARRVLQILKYIEEGPPGLVPASFQTSDAILRFLGPLWSEEMSIEPFFVSVFVNELCTQLPPDKLLEARDKSVAIYETAVFRSSLAVFSALHIGYYHLQFLNSLRESVFNTNVSHAEPSTEFNCSFSETQIDEISALATSLLQTNRVRSVSHNGMKACKGRIFEKFRDRLNRVKAEMVAGCKDVPSIFGDKGFIDAQASIT